jgi:hypothetical protein
MSMNNSGVYTDVSMYLNGKYYSMMTLKQSLGNDNIETRYHINKDTLAVYGRLESQHSGS